MESFSQFAQQLDVAEKDIIHLTSHSLDYVEFFADGMTRYLNSRIFPWDVRKVSQEEINLCQKAFDDYSKALLSLKNKISQSNELGEKASTFLLNQINVKLTTIQFHQIWLYIEAEKSGFPINPDMQKVLANKAEKLYSELFGPKITDSPTERNIIIQYFHKIFHQNKSLLSSQDQTIFKEFLDEQRTAYQLDFQLQINPLEKNCSNSIFEKQIPIHKVKKIFQIVLSMYWLEKIFHVMIDDDIPNFCIRCMYKWYDRVVWIPWKTKSISVKEVCSLIDHEINNHVLRSYNRQQTINIVSEDYSTIEEWFASLSWSLTYTNLEDIELYPIITNCCLYIAECFDFQTSIDLIKIYLLLSCNGKTEPEAIKLAKIRALRAKRYVPLGMKWANRKDVCYWRWMHIALDHALNNPNIADYLRKYYLWKISEKDFQIFQELMEEEWISSDRVIYPIFVGKIIADKLTGKQISYDSVASDPRNLWLQNITLENAKKLVDILHIFRE